MTQPTAFLKRWGGVIAAIVGLTLIALLFLSMMVSRDTTTQAFLKASFVALVGISLITLAIFFPIIFRADVSTSDDHKNERRMRRIILYSYSFAALSLIGSILPFIFVPSSFPGLYKLMLKSSVGIILGCSEAGTGKGQALAATPEPKPVPKPGEEKTPPPVADQGSQQPRNTEIPAEIDCGRGSEQWVINIGGTNLPPKDSKAAASSKEPSDDITPWPVKIRGGLVVPLYFIVLSLIGGAISLTRRVPEYHRRYSIHYVPTEDKPKLDRATVREYLAFQIIQFISAPLLAIVAYYVLSPEKRSSLILLGFAAGFSSEAILLMIRSLVEKLSPASKSA